MSSFTTLTVFLALFLGALAYKPVPLNGGCTNRPDKCADGLSCVGPAHKKLCKPLKKLNQRCGVDPYWVCDAGLVCEHNRCRIDQGYECTKSPYLCAKGLQCVGTDDYKQCEKPIKVGGSCLIEPWWVCASGLVCQHDKCRIAQGGECTKDPNWCAKGLQCVGTDDYKQCEKPIKVGESCLIEPWWVCASGLVCQHDKCRIAQGGECTKDPNWCAKGLQCVGTNHYKQCEKPIKLGGQCLIEPWWVCAAGLKCDHNICRIAQGGECTKTPYLCAKGLQCVGTKYYKQCEKPIEAGGACLIEPWWVCKSGLVCEHGKCRIPKGGDCTYKEDYCVKGLLQCVGPAGNKRCEFPLKLGESCTGTHDFCGKGLVCGGLGKARLCIEGAGEGYPCDLDNPKKQCEPGLKCVAGFCRY